MALASHYRCGDFTAVACASVAYWLGPETIGPKERRPYLEPRCVDGLPAVAAHGGVTCGDWYLPCGLEMGAARDPIVANRLRKIKTIVSVLFVTVGIASLLAFYPCELTPPAINE